MAVTIEAEINFTSGGAISVLSQYSDVTAMNSDHAVATARARPINITSMKMEKSFSEPTFSRTRLK